MTSLCSSLYSCISLKLLKIKSQKQKAGVANKGDLSAGLLVLGEFPASWTVPSCWQQLLSARLTESSERGGCRRASSHSSMHNSESLCASTVPGCTKSWAKQSAGKDKQESLEGMFFSPLEMALSTTPHFRFGFSIRANQKHLLKQRTAESSGDEQA